MKHGRAMIVAGALAIGLAWPVLAAVSPDELLADPMLEARARALGQELRCLVCQNQSIDDSDADLAKDLRRLVRERITMGDSDTQVLGFLTDRYGAFVLLRPPVTAATYALWFGPPVLLFGAAIGAVVWRRRQGNDTGRPWTDVEQVRLERVLASPDGAAPDPDSVARPDAR